ncbi:transcriptional regulators, LysR family protein [Marinomonas sp. MED121]|uniref:LysR family transcriptional regulator n=1 Tax=Marinomonas sp. MED121 TaxID=314277 RepID=UPI0000690D54|nr:LysR family transcriptional regulator [Marinomonas sp. MED121]EAQ65339.1 transcriptional regulators, LysR family protein [Marinomonas sp. MED121]
MRNNLYDKQAKLSIWLQSFYHIASIGSFSKAAKVLGQSRSTLTNHIAELESLYSVSLINRTTRSFALSQEGEALLVHCQKLNTILFDSHALLSSFSDNHEGLLRLQIPSVLDTKNFHQILSLYKQAYPQVVLDIVVSQELGDLVEDNIDVALILGDLEDTSYISRELLSIASHVVSSPSFWKNRQKPTHPNELKTLPCINYRHCRTGNQWSFSEQGKIFLVDIGPSHMCHSDEMLLSFALDGSGVTTLLDFTCREYITEGKLETCLEGWTYNIPLSALYQRRDKTPLRVKSFVDFLVLHMPAL